VPLARRRERERERSENGREDEADREGASDRVLVAEFDRFAESMREQRRE
jgi:hypothetical protein